MSLAGSLLRRTLYITSAEITDNVIVLTFTKFPTSRATQSLRVKSTDTGAHPDPTEVGESIRIPVAPIYILNSSTLQNRVKFKASLGTSHDSAWWVFGRAEGFLLELDDNGSTILCAADQCREFRAPTIVGPAFPPLDR